MAKTPKPIKWSISADEPDDMEEFLSNDDIVAKNTNKKTKDVNWPGKGPFTFSVRRLTVKPNRNGDDRISAMLVMKNPAKADGVEWNGYLIWDGFNVVEGPSLGFLKRFLKGLGLTWDDFIKRSKQDDQDPPHITQIGKVRFEGSKDVTVRAMVKIAPADDYNTEEHLEISRYLPADEDVEDDEVDDEPDEDDDEDIAVLDTSDDDDEDEADDDDEAWTREDLEDEDLDGVKQVAKEDFGLSAKELKKFKDVESLLDVLFPDESDEDEDEDDDDEDEDAIEALRVELVAMPVPKLRKRARRNDKDSDEEFESMKKPDLVQTILEQELNVPPF